MNTDTPRTDYFVNAVTRIEPQEDWVYPMVQFARELERELAALQRLRPTRDDVKVLEDDVARLTIALIDCLWATNCYDGNYAKACDHVATIATNALKTQCGMSQ